MLQICRAEDGQLFETDANLWDIERYGSLEHFLKEQTGVDEDSILAYLPDGQRLRTENVRDLAGSQNQTIYVFNKSYLELDVDVVLSRLQTEPALQPPVEETILSTPPFRPSVLSTSYLRTAHAHLDEANRILRSLHCQQEALRIASGSLDLHVLALQDTFETVSSSAQRELEKQDGLLQGVEPDLQIVSRIPVHKEFVSPNVRRAMEVGEKGRTLGDYVSQAKMRQVADTCRKTHEQLKEKLRQTHDTMSKLREGTDSVRASVYSTSLWDEAELCVRRSQELYNKIKDVTSAIEKSETQSERLVNDIRQQEASLRTELQQITRIKNEYTGTCIRTLRYISVLNNDIVKLPSTLTALQLSFRSKTSFSHIERLHKMLYAYGATVVEIVRRKEFAQFFYQRAQSILEVMAKLSANERKRRQVYRGEVHGLLPFETKGMEEPVPTIDFTPSGSNLMSVLDDLERFARESPYPVVLDSIREARTGLEKVINKMDALESGFDRIAERSLLSSSRFLEYRRRNTEADEQAYAELEQQIHQLTAAKQLRETSFVHERQGLQNEIARLRAELDSSEAIRDQQDRDLRSAKAQFESEGTSRRVLERRNSELLGEADSQRKALADALAEATVQTKTAERLRQELAQVRSEFDDARTLEQRSRDRIQSLLEDQANALRRLDEARARGEDLQSQIQSARLESDEVKSALLEASKDKERLLRAQASEHDRIMRDHIAEADGDRAVLEHQYIELKAALEDAQRQLKDIQTQCDTANSDAVGLREELQRVEHELREARHMERALREDLRTGRSSQATYEQRGEENTRLIAQLLDVAVAFRQTHVKALNAIHTLTSHPMSSKTAGSASMTESALGISRRGAVIVNYAEEPFPIDPADPATGLEALRAFDHDQFLEAVNKVGQTIRKWQKQCKEYREKAKGKISFRNFAKGDLALFLPTRNSVTKPWAAFNVSFPHYFLKPTGHLGEQLKTREWIVARITSITEGIVDHKDASTNPYGLGDGVKYYMLEVEDWTQPSSTSKRRTSAKKTPLSPNSSEPPVAESSPEPTPGPPDPDAEVEEPFPSPSATSNHFASRARGNSAPTAGPSSLSRLLAQAPPEHSVESSTPSRPQTPASPPPMPVPAAVPAPPPPQPQPSPSPTHTVATPQSSTAPLPLRSGSRASRISSSSRFSSARLPFAGASGAAKAVATTGVVSEETVPGSAATHEIFGSPKSDAASLSPDGSPTDGAAHLLPSHRRRASSFRPSVLSPAVGLPSLPSAPPLLHGTDSLPVGAGLNARTRLASLASSWGVSFSRRRGVDLPGTGEGAIARSSSTHERARQEEP